MKTQRDKVEIEAAIKEKREIMIESARIYGFTNEITLKHSQELDVLINEYQRFFRKPEFNRCHSFGKQLKSLFNRTASFVIH